MHGEGEGVPAGKTYIVHISARHRDPTTIYRTDIARTISNIHLYRHDILIIGHIGCPCPCRPGFTFAASGEAACLIYRKEVSSKYIATGTNCPTVLKACLGYRISHKGIYGSNLQMLSGNGLPITERIRLLVVFWYIAAFTVKSLGISSPHLESCYIRWNESTRKIWLWCVK